MSRTLRCLSFFLILVCGILPLTACGAGNQQVLGTYLEPYEQKAIAFLREDEAFLKLYGEDCELDASGFSFTYADPKKYSGFSLSPKIPATAEEFEQEVKELSVNLYLPDSRACTVMFEKTPEGELEITGWAYTDEAE
jgi:hypothetical protein